MTKKIYERPTTTVIEVSMEALIATTFIVGAPPFPSLSSFVYTGGGGDGDDEDDDEEVWNEGKEGWNERLEE